MNVMKCPYCGEEMQAGELRSSREGPIYWLPRAEPYKGLFLSVEKVEAQGGLVLNKNADAVPYACPSCKVLVVK